MPNPWLPGFTAGPTSVGNPYARKSVVFVEDRYMACDGWMEPSYYEPADAAWYSIGDIPPPAPVVAEVNAGAGVFPGGTVLEYQFTHRNSRFGVETPPVAYSHTIAGGPDDLQHTFGNPGGQYDQVRFYRKITGGNYKLVTTQAAGAGSWTDTVLESALLLNEQIIRRRRLTKPPRFRGWVEHRGNIFAWTGFNSALYLSQTRRADYATLGRNVLTDFPDDRILWVAPNDGHGPIVAVVSADEKLFVFKERAIYRITGGFDPLDMDIDVVTEGRGCIAQHSAVVVNSVVVFLSAQGVMLLPPEGQPFMAAAVKGANGSPLAPSWQRLNRRAANLFHAWDDDVEGLYYLCVAFDSDPVPNVPLVYDYRSDTSRFLSKDDGVFGAAAAVHDGAGLRHVLGIDDMGVLQDLDQGTNDGLPDGSDPDGTVSSAGTSAGFDTDAAFLTGYTFRGVPFELRDANGVVLEENRIAEAIPATGFVTPLYYFPTAVAQGSAFVAGGIRATARLPSVALGDPRMRKELRCVHVLHDFDPSTVSFTIYPDHKAAVAIGGFSFNDLSGYHFVDLKGLNPFRFALEITSGDPDKPWSIVAMGFDVRAHGEKG